MKASHAALGVLALLAGWFLTGGARAEERLSIGSGEARLGEAAAVPLGLASQAASGVQGFVMSFEWDPRKLVGEELVPSGGPGEALETADLVVQRVESSYMLFSVVMDADGVDQEVVPAGEHQVGTARLRCICDAPEPIDVVLAFIDAKYAFVDGGPLQDNLIVVEGRSIRQGGGLELANGSFICPAGAAGPGPGVRCGGAPDEEGRVGTAEGAPGETVSVCYYYRSPPSPLSDTSDEIQGFSLSVGYDCRLSCLEGSLSLAGSVLEEVQAEFVEHHCDNDPDDGDGCELIVGALIDAQPPFDGRTLPATADFRLLFCLDATISEAAEPDTCLAVEFVDGLDGRGTVPTSNLASIDFFEQPLAVTACEVCVVRGEVDFIRGDCNFNGTVNVADAAAQVGYLFLNGAFQPPCLDACDANDEATQGNDLDLTDVVFLLRHLFVPGSPAPPPPGAVGSPGPDPTPDGIDCRGR